MADRMFDWNDTIQNDSSFTLLPAGTYPFTVVSFERGDHSGSDRMPPCKKAMLTIEIDGGPLGTTEIKENLFLHSRAEWKLCQFFTAIGQRKRGEALQMNWNLVPGAKGFAAIVVNKYTKDGEERQNNRVDRYLDPAEVQKTAPAAPAAPAAGNFTPGQF